MLLGALAACAALVFFVHYLHGSAILLYGDAVAHVNIARRVFDSRTPGLVQFGTVWLPLPHLLILPFVVAKSWWSSGGGGSIPSMVAYVAGVLGIYRLVFRGLTPLTGVPPARSAAWLAALIYGANPNLLYLQATPMTESLALALAIWAAVFFAEFVQAVRQAELSQARSKLLRCGLMLAAGMLTRYDAWFATVFFVLAAAAVLYFRTPAKRVREGRRIFAAFLIVVAVVPVFWFAYNAAIFGNPLEFLNGPYSAGAIAQRAKAAGEPHPGQGSLWLAAKHFSKAARLDVAGLDLEKEPHWHRWRYRVEWTWACLLVLGTAAVIAVRPVWPWLALWLPLPFYTLSIAYQGVPIYVPVWWPCTYYNLRYGLQLLPAFAVFMALLVWAVAVALRSPRIRALLVAAAMLFVAFTYLQQWRLGPVCLREAQDNSAARIVFDSRLADQLRQLSPGATVLMYISNDSGALQRAGLPLRRTINESNGSIWQRALESPAQYAEFAVATGGTTDPIGATMRQHAAEFEFVATVDVPSWATATLYRRK